MLKNQLNIYKVVPGCNEYIDIFSKLSFLITLDNYAFLIFSGIVQNSLEHVASVI